MKDESAPGQDYLVFECQGARFGVPCQLVAELLWLPELTWSEHAPDFVAGVLNLRGRVVPVVDLESRLGHDSRHYQLTDKVIIVDSDGRQTGLIVEQVLDVTTIPQNLIEDTPDYGDRHALTRNLFEGIAKLEQTMVTLLSVPQLLVEPPDETPVEPDYSGSPPRTFCAWADPEVRGTLSQRARDLERVSDARNADEALSIAVVRLGDEFLGFDLDHMSQFADLENVDRIPGAHADIVGLTNVRGEIVILIGLAGVLGSRPDRSESAKKVGVVEHEGQKVGFLVDDILDVAHLDRNTIQHIDRGLGQEAGYLRGTIAWGERVVGLLDFDAIFSRYDE